MKCFSIHSFKIYDKLNGLIDTYFAKQKRKRVHIQLWQQCNNDGDDENDDDGGHGNWNHYLCTSIAWNKAEDSILLVLGVRTHSFKYDVG